MRHISTRSKAFRCTIAILLLMTLLHIPVFAAPTFLIPGGNTIGLKLYTEGLVIIQIENGTAADQAGLKTGDTILAVNGDAVSSVQDLRSRLTEDRPIVLTVLRSSRKASFLVRPDKTAQGFRLGISVRDHIAGIGTVTYYDPETHHFGALGHGVGSSQTSLAPVTSGIVIPSSVSSVQKGCRGTPGMLRGNFDLSQTLGSITSNSTSGVFGIMHSVPQKAPLPVASPNEIRTGDATILSNVNGTRVCEYSIEITKLCPDASNGRNLLLKITDPALLEKTGGIVQGMSGSPIIQDGKLVGAVTHVLVNDPTRGYGIFIENMLDAAG